MPILLISKHTGQQIMIQGESDDRDFYARAHSGLIPIQWLEGHLGHVVKDAVWATRVIPLEEHNKNIENRKKAEEEQEAEKKRQAEEQAKKRLDAITAHEKAQADEKAKAQADIEARKLKNKIKRLFQKRG